MQKPHLELQEIIWEITPECHNNCSYCGSKSVANQTAHLPTVLEIAKAIAQYPPKEITISGGDPLLIPYEMHTEIITMFKQKNIETKILFNPKSEIHPIQELPAIPELYDWRGISINTADELKKAEACLTDKRFTVVSNFNTSNIFLFNEIKNLVQRFNLTWQIQLTIYMNEDDERALYNNDEAFKYFNDKIHIAYNEDTKILIADNCNSSTCGAGRRSLGILYDGSVIPCLSFRSWKYDQENKNNYDLQGNVLKQGLKHIWENGFANYRFSEFECCKDYCKNKVVEQQCSISYYRRKKKDDNDMQQPIFPQEQWPSPKPSDIIVYGVGRCETIVYGVGKDYTITYDTLRDNGE